MRLAAGVGLAVVLVGALAWFAQRDAGPRAPGRGAPAGRDAASAPRPPDPLPPPLLHVRGLVTWGGEPVAGARIMLFVSEGGADPEGEARAAADSDGDGRFSLAPVAAACALVRVTAEVGAPAIRLARPGAEELAIELPAAVRQEERRAPPATGRVSGVVRDPAGAPVARAHVRARSWSSEDAWREAVADAEGRYALEGMRAGLLETVEVAAPGATAQACLDLPFCPVPAKGELAFDPVVRPGVDLTGTVAGGAARVVLARLDPPVRRLAVVAAGEGGAFAFRGLVPGRYLVHLDPRARFDLLNTRSVPPGLRDRAIVAVGDAAPPPVLLAAPATASVVAACDPRHAGTPVSLRVESARYATRVGERGEARWDHVPATPRGDVWMGTLHAGPFAVPAGDTVTVSLRSEPRAVFTGVVEDPDGRPLPGARVHLADEASDTAWRWWSGGTVSDGAGRFRLELGAKDLAERWVVFATCPGMVMGFARGLPQPDAGAEVEVRVRLGAGVSLRGTVVDAAGTPVAGAGVHAATQDEFWSRSTCRFEAKLGQLLDAGPLQASAQGITDAGGHFVLANLAPGTYFLTASAKGAESEQVEAEAKEGAEPVRLVLGPRTLPVAGVVLDEGGRRVANAYVGLTRGYDGAISDAHGRFRIDGLPPGPHDFEVKPSWRAGEGTPGFEPRVVEQVDAGTTDLVIRVEPGRVVEGRVVGPLGEGVQGAHVVVLPPPPEDRESMPMTPPYAPNAFTAADGSFELRGVPDGPLEIGVFAAGYLHGRFDGIDAPLRLSRGASVGGRVLDVDGKPRARHWVRLELEEPARPEQLDAWLRRNRFRPHYAATTGDDGRFLVTGLPDGTYEVDAGRAIPALRVRAGDTDVLLKEQAFLPVAGVVVDENGRPATHDGEGERLKISAYVGDRIVGFIPLESDGSFRFENAPPGTVRLRVLGYPRFEEGRMDVPAGTENVRLQLKPGRWRDHDRKPLVEFPSDD